MNEKNIEPPQEGDSLEVDASLRLILETSRLIDELVKLNRAPAGIWFCAFTMEIGAIMKSHCKSEEEVSECLKDLQRLCTTFSKINPNFVVKPGHFK